MSFRGVAVCQALDSAVVALSAAGVESPRLDAELLLAHALGVERTRLFLEPDRPVEGPAVRAFQSAVRERSVRRVPVAYLVGHKGFRHLELDVDPRVLIPRPETEHLVEWAVAALPHGGSVVDVGTGSGAVALALKHERPDLDVRATDISQDALDVARANGERLGLDVAWGLGDLDVGDAHAVLSNPPYVEVGAALAPELSHEPGPALFAGADGLDVLRRLVGRLDGARWAAFEVGRGQADAVRGMFGDPWTTGIEHDLAGIERVVTAWR